LPGTGLTTRRSRSNLLKLHLETAAPFGFPPEVGRRSDGWCYCLSIGR